MGRWHSQAGGQAQETWDRFDAEQGDEAEAAEQGGAGGGEQGGEE